MNYDAFVNFVEALLRDARLAARVLRKSPAFYHHCRSYAGFSDLRKRDYLQRAERAGQTSAERASGGEPL